MKKINLTMYLLIVASAITGCKKDFIGNRTSTGTLPSQTNAPVVNAGADIRLEIPLTHTPLTGTAYDADGNITNYNWRKIAGPESYFLEWPNNLSPKLVWLEEGNYEFEFTATDKKGLFDKDTVKVTVFSELKKYILHNLTRDASGFLVAQIPPEVVNNIKWVFGKSGSYCERADAGPYPGIDYFGGGYYYEILPGNVISVYTEYAGNIDVIIYY